MTNLKGKEFESLIAFRAQKLADQKILTLGRYGVQAVMMKNRETGKPEWMIVPSLPDFEGVIHGSGRQIIIEAKVCSQASYPLFATNKKRPKQIDHMLERAEFGALCFLLIHWNERHLMKSSYPAETFAIPVLDNHFWRTYQAVEQKSLDRQQCELYGFRIPWNLYSSRASKETPDLTYLLPERPEFKLTP